MTNLGLLLVYFCWNIGTVNCDVRCFCYVGALVLDWLGQFTLVPEPGTSAAWYPRNKEPVVGIGNQVLVVSF